MVLFFLKMLNYILDPCNRSVWTALVVLNTNNQDMAMRKLNPGQKNNSATEKGIYAHSPEYNFQNFQNFVTF